MWLQHKEDQIRAQLENVQRILQPVTIINPYAESIALPSSANNPRRTLPILLSFIEAITFYHQYQRESKVDTHTGEMYIETTLEDIKWGFKLLKSVLFRKSDELSGACRSFYQWLQDWYKQHKVETPSIEQTGFSSNQIRKSNSIHDTKLSSRHLSLF